MEKSEEYQRNKQKLKSLKSDIEAISNYGYGSLVGLIAEALSVPRPKGEPHTMGVYADSYYQGRTKFQDFELDVKSIESKIAEVWKDAAAQWAQAAVKTPQSGVNNLTGFYAAGWTILTTLAASIEKAKDLHMSGGIHLQNAHNKAKIVAGKSFWEINDSVLKPIKDDAKAGIDELIRALDQAEEAENLAIRNFNDLCKKAE